MIKMQQALTLTQPSFFRGAKAAMHGPTLQTIAQIKLRALHEQHASLNRTYDAIEERANDAQDAEAELRALYDGLRECKFGLRPMHTGLQDLDTLFFEIEEGLAPEGRIRFWCRKLRRELLHAKQRAQMSYALSAVLEEWTRDEEREVQEVSGQSKESAMAFLRETLETEVSPSFARFDAWWKEAPEALEELQEEAQRFAEEEIWEPIEEHELYVRLQELQRNRHLPLTHKAGLQTIAGDSLILRECAQALNLMLENIDEWAWPAAGVAGRMLWTQNRWRGFLQPELMDMLLLEVIGARWSVFFKEALRAYPVFAPQDGDTGTKEASRRHSLDGLNCATFGELDEEVAHGSIAQQRAELGGQLWLASLPSSVDEMDASLYNYQSSAHAAPGDLQADEQDLMQKILASLSAELELARATGQIEGMTLLRTDLQQYFPSFPHALAMRLCEVLGIPERWQRFFLRFLQAPLAMEGQQTLHCKRGIPLDHRISILFAELSLLCLEGYVFQQSGLRLLRFMDDIFFLSPDATQAVRGWQALQDFCEDVGVALNPDKTGASTLLQEDDAQLIPQKPFQWAFLDLQSSGRWSVCPARITRLKHRLKTKLETPDMPVLSIIAIYNNYARYLLRGMAVPTNLGEQHFQIVHKALIEVHTTLFDGESIATFLQKRLTERFASQMPEAKDWPAHWLYWPILAGGLELLHPVACLEGFRKSLPETTSRRPPESRGPDWLSESSAWGEFYRERRQPLASEIPFDSAGSGELGQALVETLSSGKHYTEELSNYWHWLLHIYGAEMQERFGGVSFLSSPQLPVQLVAQGREETIAADMGA